jgi:hypothetical protein
MQLYTVLTKDNISLCTSSCILLGTLVEAHMESDASRSKAGPSEEASGSGLEEPRIGVTLLSVDSSRQAPIGSPASSSRTLQTNAMRYPLTKPSSLHPNSTPSSSSTPLIRNLNRFVLYETRRRFYIIASNASDAYTV